MKIISHIFLASLIFTLSSFAEEPLSPPQPDRTVILHQAVRAVDLPTPGAPLQLTVSLQNTRDTTRKMRALIVSDGQFFELSSNKAVFNRREEPTYTFEIIAPLGELVYQFLIPNKNSGYIVSERFQIRRACLPSVEPAPDSIDQSLQGDARLNALETTSKKLERDIIRYQTTIDYINRIRKLMNR
jgi:hypothetical protein